MGWKRGKMKAKLTDWGEIEINLNSSGYSRHSMSEILEKTREFWPKARLEDLLFSSTHRAERGCGCHSASTEDYDSFLIIERRSLARKILSLRTGNMLERNDGDAYKHTNPNAGGSVVRRGDYTCESETQTPSWIWENFEDFQEQKEADEC